MRDLAGAAPQGDGTVTAMLERPVEHAARAPRGFLTPGGDELLAISSVVQGLVEASGASTFGELVDRLDAGDRDALEFAAHHQLTSRQIELVDRHLDLLRRLPIRSIAVLRRCPVCGAYDLLAGTDSTPCRASTGCRGRTVSAPLVWRAPWNDVRALGT